MFDNIEELYFHVEAICPPLPCSAEGVHSLVNPRTTLWLNLMFLDVR